MKILHTADLHIGKKLFEQSLIEDQKYILGQIKEIALREKVDVAVIAGDVYDRPVPPAEAVSLLDEFLTGLIKEGIKVIMISGNHDSPERVAFADRILEGQGLYIAGEYQTPLKTVVLLDEYGPVTFVCMPFVKPGVVGISAQGGNETAMAVEQMLSRTPMTLSLNQRSVLVTHYFVTGENGEVPQLSDSETDVNVGGLDNVPAGVFAGFDYVALGHIHKPQHIGEGNVYYSGAPLKYSFGEALGTKSVNLVELRRPRQVTVRKIPLKPLRQMRCIKGRLADLISREVVSSCDGREDYIQASLTDTEELIDPVSTLRSVYPNVLQVLLEKNLPGADGGYESRIPMEQKGMAELFGDFYEMLKGEPMDEIRKSIVEDVAKVCGREGQTKAGDTL
ncbi:MAG: exonuclease SbcCD subunit D [Lachnospiraceae bacterium]|nr:exonuclease SbcCD subunit D [Lachnospiraceae bacterium]